MEYNGLIDLHTHTVFSDGELTPGELLQTAAANGVKILAITDHDTVDGVEAAVSEAQKLGIKIIPGIEFSTAYSGELHILGYNIDIHSEALLTALENLKAGREKRLCRMIDKLNELGFELERSDIEAAEHSIVGRTHIARAMLKKGYVSTLTEAFDKYIGAGKPAYISGDKLNARQVIELIKAAHGTAIIAHPKSLKLSDNEFEKFLVSLVEFGLGGVEVYYPSHSAENVAFYKRLCQKYGLVCSGGTDYHGKLRANIVPGVPMYRPSKTDAKILGLN